MQPALLLLLAAAILVCSAEAGHISIKLTGTDRICDQDPKYPVICTSNGQNNCCKTGYVCHWNGQCVSKDKGKEICNDKEVCNGGCCPDGYTCTNRGSCHKGNSYGEDNNYGEGQDGSYGEGQDNSDGEGQDGSYSEDQDDSDGEGQDGSYGEGQDDSDGEGQDDSDGEGHDHNDGEGQDDSDGEGQDGSYGEGQDNSDGEGQDGSYSEGQDDSDGEGQDDSDGEGQDDSDGEGQDGSYGEDQDNSDGEGQDGSYGEDQDDSDGEGHDHSGGEDQDDSDGEGQDNSDGEGSSGNKYSYHGSTHTVYIPFVEEPGNYGCWADPNYPVLCTSNTRVNSKGKCCKQGYICHWRGECVLPKSKLGKSLCKQAHKNVPCNGGCCLRDEVCTPAGKCHKEISNGYKSSFKSAFGNYQEDIAMNNETTVDTSEPGEEMSSYEQSGQYSEGNDYTNSTTEDSSYSEEDTTSGEGYGSEGHPTDDDSEEDTDGAGNGQQDEGDSTDEQEVEGDSTDEQEDEGDSTDEQDEGDSTDEQEDEGDSTDEQEDKDDSTYGQEDEGDSTYGQEDEGDSGYDQKNGADKPYIPFKEVAGKFGCYENEEYPVLCTANTKYNHEGKCCKKGWICHWNGDCVPESETSKICKEQHRSTTCNGGCCETGHQCMPDGKCIKNDGKHKYGYRSTDASYIMLKEKPGRFGCYDDPNYPVLCSANTRYNHEAKCCKKGWICHWNGSCVPKSESNKICKDKRRKTPCNGGCCKTGTTCDSAGDCYDSRGHKSNFHAKRVPTVKVPTGKVSIKYVEVPGKFGCYANTMYPVLCSSNTKKNKDAKCCKSGYVCHWNGSCIKASMSSTICKSKAFPVVCNGGCCGPDYTCTPAGKCHKK